jgi:hypothetical protein
MKKFIVVFLTTLLAAVIVPASHGIEPERDVLDRTGPTLPGSTTASRIQKNDPAAIAKLIDDINAAVRSNKQRMLSIITINTDVAGSQLEQEKARTGMTFGDVYVAHSLALATKKKFNAMVELHKSGKSWADIAKSHNVTLKGSTDLIEQMKKQQ